MHDAVRAALLVAQVVEPHDRHDIEPQLLRRHHAAVALDYLGAVGAVPHGHGVVEAELPDALAYLVDLLVGVDFRVARVRYERFGGNLFHRQLGLLLHGRSLPAFYLIGIFSQAGHR